eukprot:CAMPEP_0177578650 /NCGR_PEP_ID=MMETSP0419_2-20121207/470_1 /TAXON_ID=582737 /ORGANISM="Tetraselmis sp., Strain GSL018" /LENGTH=100 /DNA_ID=CAMNT_0019067125 /DNA_START=286 /DNA_END=585 /DNA_ORIENTATION=-
MEDSQPQESWHSSEDFNHFLKKACSEDMPEDVRKQISKGLEKQHMLPPVEVAKAVLERPVTEDWLRRLLFYPSEDDMREYPRMIRMRPAEATPKDQPHEK